MKSNLSPLALDEMSIDDIARLDIEEISRLHDETRDTAKAWRDRQGRIIDALEQRFGARALHILTEQKKHSGTVHFPEDGFDVKRVTGHDVVWDQTILAGIRGRIITASENPDVYMTPEYKVAEAAYRTWPVNIREEFDKGRTIKPRRATYEFTPAKATS